MPEPTGRPRHRALGGLLSLAAVAAAGVGLLVRFAPDRLADGLGREALDQTLWLTAALLALAAVALVIGLILLFQRRSARRPDRADQSSGPSDSSRDQPPIEPPPADHCPPDQAIGRGWARAVDLVESDDPTSRTGLS
ncbi:MAG: hypothetical protein LBK54_00345 [Propionibacteriaceae bacterium]|nr:hypothetical protein [Propionibacteriaceae bacterium]